MTKARFVIPAAGFFAAAAIIRFFVRHIESRLQIVLFLVIALIWELVRMRLAGNRASIAAVALNATCAATAIIIVKCYTEKIVI